MTSLTVERDMRSVPSIRITHSTPFNQQRLPESRCSSTGPSHLLAPLRESCFPHLRCVMELLSKKYRGSSVNQRTDLAVGRGLACRFVGAIPREQPMKKLQRV